MPECWPIHTIVLDLDDTLYPERDYVLSGFQAADAWVKARYDVGGFADRALALFWRESVAASLMKCCRSLASWQRPSWSRRW